MTMQDPISDMFTRIRNAQARERKDVSMPASKVKSAIANVLKDEGYILDHRTEEVDGYPTLTIDLKYHQGVPVIEKIQRTSRPGLRVYRGKDALPTIVGGARHRDRVHVEGPDDGSAGARRGHRW